MGIKRGNKPTQGKKPTGGGDPWRKPVSDGPSEGD